MINWKVRLRSKVFWITMTPLLVVLANQIAGIFEADITVYSDKATALIETILAILCGLGIIIDPTTSGVSDSEQALAYVEPKKDGEQ